MHSARLIAHQKRGCSTQRRRRRERCHERNDVGGAGFVKKLPGQAPAASLYFRPVQCGFRCTDVGEASTQEHPNIEGKGETTRNTKKKVSFDQRTFKLSSAIWANRAATEVRWRNAGDFGQNRAIWWEWGADMRKLKMKKKNLVRNIHSERNWCEKGLQVSSCNGFYSAQNNKERPSHWKRHKERDDDIGWVRGLVVLTAPPLSSPLKIPGQT